MKYEEFMAQYVEPSYNKFLWDKFFNFPKFRKSHFAAYEPMTTGEIDSFAAAIDPEGKFPEDVTLMVRARARTSVGNYLLAWIAYFKDWKTSYKDFCYREYCNAYDAKVWGDDNDRYIEDFADNEEEEDTLERHQEAIIDWD